MSHTDEQEKSKEVNNASSRVMGYFSANSWNFPVDVELDSINYQLANIDKKLIQTGERLDTALLRRQLVNWCYVDSLFKRKREGIKISTINVTEAKPLKREWTLNCIVDFYSDGEIRNGAVLPVEGRAIIDNKLLKQRERAYFLLTGGKLKFLKWYN